MKIEANPQTKPATKSRPAFIAALTREVDALIRQPGWTANQTHLLRGIHLFEHKDAIVVCAGMGAHRASLAVEAALKTGPLSELVSVGFAGASVYRLHAGDIVSPDIVVDRKTGERFFPDKDRAPTDSLEILVTVESPAGVKEKQDIGVSYYASAIDMEAASVARLAQAHQLPFLAIKAISDDSLFELSDLAQFSTTDGQFRELAFGLHAALRPHLWKRIRTLAIGSKLAAGRLHVAIQERMQHPRKPS